LYSDEGRSLAKLDAFVCGAYVSWATIQDAIEMLTEWRSLQLDDVSFTELDNVLHLHKEGATHPTAASPPGIRTKAAIHMRVLSTMARLFTNGWEWVK
jgi:hypothetical protein